MTMSDPYRPRVRGCSCPSCKDVPPNRFDTGRGNEVLDRAQIMALRRQVRLQQAMIQDAWEQIAELKQDAEDTSDHFNRIIVEKDATIARLHHSVSRYRAERRHLG